MPAFRRLDDAEAAHRRALVRVDFNVPMADGRVSDDTRLRAALPTINALRAKGAKVLLLAHFDRPKGQRVPAMSLQPIAAPLAALIGAPGTFVDDCIGEPVAAAIAAMADGDVALLENTRFHAGEVNNDPEFAQALAANGDLYVNDAFSAAHRAHASTEGLAHLLPAYAGKSMEAELTALDKALGAPERPVVAIVGGAKVSTKLDLLGNLVAKVDVLIIGGGMANTFLHARGVDIGKSLCEKDLAPTAREIEQKALAANCRILLPSDGALSKEFKAGAAMRFAPVTDVAPDEMILDIGPDTIAAARDAFKGAKTLIWNGPVGAFEIEPFDQGTVALARLVAELTKDGTLVSVAGGGDTVAALHHAGAADAMTFVSTAGGAFLEWMEGKPLPGVDALKG